MNLTVMFVQHVIYLDSQCLFMQILMNLVIIHAIYVEKTVVCEIHVFIVK